MSKRRKGTDDPMEVLRLIGRVVVDIQQTEQRLSADRRAGVAGKCSTHPTDDHCRGDAVLHSLQDVGLDVLPRWAADQAAAMAGARAKRTDITMYDVTPSPN